MMHSQDDDRSVDRSDSPGGLPPEPVEDRPNVGTVKPEDYPDRAESVPGGGAGSGAQSPPGLDEEKDDERRNPGSAHRTPSEGPSGDGQA